MREQERAVGYRCGRYVIDPAQRRLQCDGTDVALEAKVFDLILLLLEHRERALGKQEVIEALWGNRPISDAALSQLVYKARRAFDDGSGRRDGVIRTVYGRGLQWVAPVSPVAAGTSPLPADADPSAVSDTPPVREARRHRRAVWISIGAAVLLVLLGWWIIPRGFAPPAPPPQRLAVLPIDNRTGDAALDWTTRGLPGLIANLLGDSPDLGVVDPLQVARVWKFTPPKGRSQAEHTRYVTGADILVTGELTRLPGKLFELTLHIDPGKRGNATDIVLSGSAPSTLGIAAVSRLRRALKLEPLATSPFEDKPQDAYLAETFARGIDLAMHDDLQGAKPYFLLVNKSDPQFLPARFLLARIDGNTNQLREADASYAALLADARRLNRPALAARVLDDQASQASNRHENAKALTLVTEAMSMARQTNDPEILARVLLNAARANARLNHIDLAMKQYDQARVLIEKTRIRRLQPLLHNTMAFIADARNDPAASIAAARAELDADQALGKERSSAIASFNLAYALYSDDRPLEALPLLVRVWSWTGQHQDTALQAAAGTLMTSLLYERGVYGDIRAIIDTTARLAATQNNSFAQAQMLSLRAGGEYFSGDKTAALADCRKATSLIDPAQDPATAVEKLMSEAFVALTADPAAVADIRGRVDVIVGHMADPSNTRYLQYLVHALATAAAGNRQGAQRALEAAARAPQSSADQVHQVALQIALATHDDAIAQSPMHGFKPAAADVTADTLRLYSEWSARRGDAAGRQRAQARFSELRQSALDGLAKAGFDPTHSNHGDRGHP